MAEGSGNPGMIIVWVAAAVLVLLVVLSFTGDGTWMGGMGMGWMMGGGVLLLLAAFWAAYRYGRMEAKVERLEKDAEKKA